MASDDKDSKWDYLVAKYDEMMAERPLPPLIDDLVAALGWFALSLIESSDREDADG